MSWPVRLSPSPLPLFTQTFHFSEQRLSKIGKLVILAVCHARLRCTVARLEGHILLRLNSLMLNRLLIALLFTALDRTLPSNIANKLAGN